MFLKLVELLPPNYRNKIVYNFSKNLFSLLPLPFEKEVLNYKYKKNSF